MNPRKGLKYSSVLEHTPGMCEDLVLVQDCTDILCISQAPLEEHS